MISRLRKFLAKRWPAILRLIKRLGPEQIDQMEDLRFCSTCKKFVVRRASMSPGFFECPCCKRHL